LKNLTDAARQLCAELNEHGFRGREIHSAYVDGGDFCCSANAAQLIVTFVQDGVPVSDLVEECRSLFGRDCQLEIKNSLGTAYISAYR
jgi:hypothetical protein